MNNHSKIIDTFQPSLLSAALHNINMGILILKRNGEILFCNREASRLVGASALANKGRLLKDVFFTIDGEQLFGSMNPILRAISEDNFGVGQFKLINPDGSSFIVECRTEALLPSAFEMPAVLVSITDITLDLLEKKTLKENNIRLISENKELKELAMFDQLTKLRNRNYFDLVLSQRMEQAIVNAEPLSLLLIDIDYFKQFNDNYGHLNGDDCLAKVAGITRDIVSPDYIARFGGEEFCILLPEADAPKAETVAKKLQEAIRGAGIEHNASPYGHITVSIGVCCTEKSKPKNPRELIRLADKALYDAKSSGRNCVVVHTPPSLMWAS